MKPASAAACAYVVLLAYLDAAEELCHEDKVKDDWRRQQRVLAPGDPRPTCQRATGHHERCVSAEAATG